MSHTSSSSFKGFVLTRLSSLTLLSLFVMTTRSDSVDCLVQDPLTSSEKASISREDSSEDSIKVVSLHEKEAQAMMDVDCPGVFSVSEASSSFLDEDKVELKQIKETSAEQDDVHKGD